jgi:hypothetical protein
MIWRAFKVAAPAFLVANLGAPVRTVAVVACAVFILATVRAESRAERAHR